MRITPTEEDARLAREIHAEFAAKRFSEHIASIWSLMHISALFDRAQPINGVLEIGGGIGTVTKLLLCRSPLRVTTVERWEQFRRELRKNVGDAPDLTLVSKIREVEGPFDLVIVDGSASPRFLDFLTEGVTVFIEGSRGSQRRMISETLKERGLIAEFESYIPEGVRSEKGCHVATIRSANG